MLVGDASDGGKRQRGKVASDGGRWGWGEGGMGYGQLMAMAMIQVL